MFNDYIFQSQLGQLLVVGLNGVNSSGKTIGPMKEGEGAGREEGRGGREGRKGGKKRGKEECTSTILCPQTKRQVDSSRRQRDLGHLAAVLRHPAWVLVPVTTAHR